MNDTGCLYIQFSPGLRDELGDDIPLQDIVNQAGIDRPLQWRRLPPGDPGERSKALVETVVITSTAAVALAVVIRQIETAITEYLDHKAVRDSHYGYYVNEPVIGSNGKPLEDKDGSVLLVRRRVSGFDAFPIMPREGLTLVVGEQGLEFRSGEQSGGADAEGETATK